MLVLEAKIFIVYAKSLKSLLLTTFKTTPSSTDSLYNHKPISYDIKGLQKSKFFQFLVKTYDVAHPSGSLKNHFWHHTLFEFIKLLRMFYSSNSQFLVKNDKQKLVINFTFCQFVHNKIEF